MGAALGSRCTGGAEGGVPAPITLGTVLVGADAVWLPWAEPLAWPAAPDQQLLSSTGFPVPRE